jgi:hypothetical protein
MICGGAIYRFYRLDYFAVFLVLVFTTIAFILLKKTYFCKQEESSVEHQLSTNIKYSVFILTCYFLLLTFNFLILFQSSTSASIISPWQTVPWYFWLTFTANTILLIAIILKNSLSNFIYWSLVIGYWLLCFSIAVIIYQIGFGFDPFIHQATEKLIDATGAVNPKPWYYLGQYALIVILHKLTFVPIVWLDKLLVPALAALTLPYALYQAAKNFTADERVTRLTSLLALVFPFATFTITTPQNLANLFLIIAILLSLVKSNQNKTLVTHYSLLITLSLAALLTHPIAGIPAVIFVIMLFPFCHCEESRAARDDVAISPCVALKTGLLLRPRRIAMTRYIFYFLLLTSASALSLPFAFYLNNKTNSVINAVSDTTSQITWQLPKLFFSGTENFLLNFVYLYGFNIGIIITAFVIIGIIIYIRHSSLVTRHLPYLLMSLSLLVSYLLTKTIDFGYLIDYERSNFSDRILIIAVYFALPFILLALTKLIEVILRQERVVKFLFLCFLVILLSCSLYFSYPRYDDYYNSRSFSASQTDVDAVNWINQDAGNNNFIVLANQQVSAAALREFGFKKYFLTASGQVFYYPIPTGEKLYQYYLDMVDKNADKKTALAAADFVGADTVYFVINNYWFGFDKILAEAALGADVVQNIDNGKIYIFKYTK